MAISKEKKQELILKFQRSKTDVGSSEVQIAILSYEIDTLTDHMKENKKDVHSKRGLIKKVSNRRRHLTYLKNNQPDRYTKILKDLNLRK